jgi:hypothetical protein
LVAQQHSLAQVSNNALISRFVQDFFERVVLRSSGATDKRNFDMHCVDILLTTLPNEFFLCIGIEKQREPILLLFRTASPLRVLK